MRLLYSHTDRQRTATQAWPLSFLFGLALLATALPAVAQNERLRSAPPAPMRPMLAATGQVQQRGGLQVDPSDRTASINFYRDHYVVQPDELNLDWTGNHERCDAGATAQRFREAILRRINYFGAMAGVPADITFSDAYSRKAQAAALMMSVNRNLNHFPAQTWRCYTADGADAAASSNLYLQVLSPDAIDGYINDPGSSNALVPHRRWLLYPQTVQMGSGDVPAMGELPAANALWVIDATHYFDPRPSTRDGFVAWPPPGFVPEHLIFRRWSLSYANADFTDAHLVMTLNGQSLEVQLLSDGPGYGEASLIWQPELDAVARQLAAPASEYSFQVEVSNVLVNGEMQSFGYAITTFEPEGDGPPPQNFLVHAPLVMQ